MKKYQLYLSFLVFVISSNLSSAQTKIIQLQLDGKKYETMSLKANLYGLNKQSVEVKGQSNDGYYWKFAIPDSIVSHTQWYDIRTGEYNPLQKKVFEVSLMAIFQNDTIDGNTGRLIPLYDEKMPVLQMQYVKSKIINESSYQITDSLWMENGQLIIDQFLLSPIIKGSDFAIELENPQVSMPYLCDNNQAFTHTLDSLSQKHPDSRYLMMQASVYTVFRANKMEGKNIYNNFSKANRNTYWGKRMKKYLYPFQFQNMELPTSANLNNKERVIIDSKKYNLIVFSASWCGPCREEIPILKHIYNDLNAKLDIVYISIDEAKAVEAWQKLIQMEAIPWRSLNAYKNNNKVKKQYNLVFGIPCSLLVAPNGVAEFLDVRKAEDKQLLYQLVGNNSN